MIESLDLFMLLNYAILHLAVETDITLVIYVNNRQLILNVDKIVKQNPLFPKKTNLKGNEGSEINLKLHKTSYCSLSKF